MLLKLVDLYSVPSVSVFFDREDTVLTNEEQNLLKMFRALNKEGQRAVSDHATALVASGLYRKMDIIETAM